MSRRITPRMAKGREYGDPMTEDAGILRTKRRKTRQVHLGPVAVGGEAPISVQTMTKTDTRDASRTIEQILDMESIGCDIIRVAVADAQSARALAAIRPAIRIPLVADIHFDHNLALMALDAGADGLRINPGNIGGTEKIRAVARAAARKKAPIRVGVNSGSLEKDILEKHGGATAEALVESAIRNVRIIEDCGHGEIKISAKASDTARTVRSYRLLSSATDHPLHLGLTESGTLLSGTVHSSIALCMLLSEGIGDTIRVSLTEQPDREVRAGLEILRALGLRKAGPRVISCPTCGRVEIDVIGLAHEVEKEMEKLFRKFPGAAWPSVAVMGCMVNGPGEAAEADIAVAGGKGKAALFAGGKSIATVKEAHVVAALVKQVEKWVRAHASKPDKSAAGSTATAASHS